MKTRLRLGLLWIVMGWVCGVAGGPAYADEEMTWHAETLTSSPRGLHVTQYWSRGREEFRAETVIAGHRLVTIINGDTYYSVDRMTGKGIAVERSKKARKEDKKRSRPFAVEGWIIQERGGEKIRSAELAGRMCDVWRLTDSTGRREVWIQQEPVEEALPLRVEVYNRVAGTNVRTDFVQWASGLGLPDHLFVPDPRMEVTHFAYEEFMTQASKGELKQFPVLHAALLHGPK